MSQIPRRAGDHGSSRGPGGFVDLRQLERSVSWSVSERLRCHWYRFRLTVADMNYATQRLGRVSMALAPRVSVPAL